MRGTRASSAVISRRARRSAKASRYWPPAYIRATIEAASASPEGQRGGHRERRDDVESDISTPQTGHNLGEEREQHRQRGGRPNRFRPGTETDEARGETAGEAEHGETGEPGPDTVEARHSAEPSIWRAAPPCARSNRRERMRAQKLDLTAGFRPHCGRHRSLA